MTKNTRMNAILQGTFSFRLQNLLPAIGFDQGFILQHGICKIEYEREQQRLQNNDNYNGNGIFSNSKKWEWIYNLSGLKCMETAIIILGQFEKGHTIQYSMKPFVEFSNMQQPRNDFQLW